MKRRSYREKIRDFRHKAPIVLMEFFFRHKQRIDRGNTYIGFFLFLVNTPLALLTILGVFGVSLKDSLVWTGIAGIVMVITMYIVGYIDLHKGGFTIEKKMNNQYDEQLQKLLEAADLITKKR